jgi:hypothetical protein
MTRKNVPVRNAVLLQRVHESVRNVVLASHVGKALRPVFASQNLITHAGTTPEK